MVVRLPNVALGGGCHTWLTQPGPRQEKRLSRSWLIGCPWKARTHPTEAGNKRLASPGREPPAGVGGLTTGTHGRGELHKGEPFLKNCRKEGGVFSRTLAGLGERKREWDNDSDSAPCLGFHPLRALLLPSVLGVSVQVPKTRR